MSFRTVQQNNIQNRNTEPSGLLYNNNPSNLNSDEVNGWIRNPSWLAMTSVSAAEQKIVILAAIFPSADSNFVAMTITGAYTVDWGDGTSPQNYTSGSAANYRYDYNAAGLANTDAPVTFTTANNKVNRTSHGYRNGMKVRFYKVATTTTVLEGQNYFVINADDNTFQLSESVNGSVVTINADGTANLLPYKQALITVTPQAANNFTVINLTTKHNQSFLSNYHQPWLDIIISAPNMTTFNGVGSGNNPASILERLNLLSMGNVTSFFNIFQNAYSLKTCSFPSTSTVTNFSSMFSSCSSLEIAPFLNTSNGTNFSTMFSGCTMLKFVPLYNLEKATNLTSMFSTCTSLKNVPAFNTPLVNTMTGMFNGCTALESVPLLNTAAVTAMNTMFQSCTNLRNVPLFNTRSVTDMSSMFNACRTLESVPLFNTVSVTTMSTMFQSCESLKSVPLFNTSNVKIMSSMFSGCSSLRTVPLFDTGEVTSMASMFSSCASLKNVPNFNTKNVKIMSSMFSGCTFLNNPPAVNTSNANIVSSMFQTMTSIKRIPKYDFSRVNVAISIFNGCTALEHVPELNLQGIATAANSATMFSGCVSLASCNVTNVRANVSFAGCKMSANTLNAFFTNSLASGVTNLGITITSNWGSNSANKAIANTKGWRVII